MDIITRDTLVFYASFLIPIFAFCFLVNNKSIKMEQFVYKYLSIAYVLFIIILIGFRKIGFDGFTDTKMYMNWFVKSKIEGIINTKDIGFGLWVYLLSFIVNVRFFFVLCTLLSFGLLIWSSYKIAKDRWFLMLLGIMISIYFWNSEVFTIRQGIASNFMLVAILSDKRYSKFIFSLLAISFHQSFVLSALCFLIVSHLKNTNIYLYIWCATLFISSIFNNEILTFFSKVVGLKNFKYYLFSNEFLNLNFRWDVVIFSLFFICIGLYNLKFKKAYIDEKYILIVNLFILSNAFLLLLGKSNIMHRFAYVSWFLIPLLIFYPMLKNKPELNISNYIAWIVGMYIFILSYTGYKIFTQNMKYIPDVESVENIYK